MAYHLKHKDPSIEAGVRRIAKSQIEAAIGEIADDGLDNAGKVHQVRKRCKKLRALVRLVRPAFPDYAAENAAFRDAARSLSGLRDAHVMVETFDKLAGRHGDRFDRRRFQPIRERLLERRRAASGEGDLASARLALFRDEMVEALDRSRGWTLEADGAEAFRGGLRKTLKRAAGALEAARKDPTTETMHALRKRAKYHWYHVRLLKEVWPATMEPLADELDRLGDILGDEHDLAVFQDEVVSLAGDGEDRGAATELRRLAGERRRELQTVGIALADRAFVGGAGGLAERLADLHDAWRRAPDLEDPAEEAAGDGTAQPGRGRSAADPDDADREIERKFRVTGEDWREAVTETRHIRQGYLASTDRLSLRVRITDDRSAEMTAKSADPEKDRIEVEFKIPVTKARALMDLAQGAVIEKRRHVVPVNGTTFELDEFEAPEKGLVLAEVELDDPDGEVPKTAWLGKEVTGEAAYYGDHIAGVRK